MAIQINVEFLFSHMSHFRFFTFIICMQGQRAAQMCNLGKK